MTSAKAVLARSMTEDQLLEAILGAALRQGWLAHHVRRSDKALQQGHPGFPDLVLARKGRVMFVELKSAKGRQTAAQADWEAALAYPLMSVDHDYYCVWPRDLDDILGALESLTR